MSDNKKIKRPKENEPLPSSYTTGREIKFPEYKFKIDEFAVRGLNKYRNFISPPLCECCNEPMEMLFETKEELDEFCEEVLLENGCSHSAIFLIYKDGRQRVIFTIPEWDHYEPEDPDDETDIGYDYEYIDAIGVGDVKDNDGFAVFDAKMGLHCYGLMIEQETNKWMVQE